MSHFTVDDYQILIHESVNETREADLTAKMVQQDRGKIWRVQPRMKEMVGNRSKEPVGFFLGDNSFVYKAQGELLIDFD